MQEGMPKLCACTQTTRFALAPRSSLVASTQFSEQENNEKMTEDCLRKSRAGRGCSGGGGVPRRGWQWREYAKKTSRPFFVPNDLIWGWEGTYRASTAEGLRMCAWDVGGPRSHPCRTAARGLAMRRDDTKCYLGSTFCLRCDAV
jgi:hypothetical protein